jgi:bacterial leucyl aminopeptidase
VKFMAYAAEEVGLVGSAEIADAYHDQGVNVVGVLQLDMTNYKGSSGDIYIYTDFTNPTQNAFVGSLVDTYLPGLIKGTSSCGYGCSDHASWTSEGYPASFPFEAVFGQHNPFIHTPQDTIDKSGGTANHALKFSKLAAAYLAETAKGGFGTN